MKLRLFFLSILALCLLNVAGYFPVFKMAQWQIRHKIEGIIEQSLPNEHLNLISISAENQHELRWERPHKEFWYKGQLYDIVRSVKSEGVIHYYCIEDTAETHLAYEFIENIKKQTDNSDAENTPLSHFFKKILKIYFPPNYIAEEPLAFIQKPKKNKVLVPYLNFYVSDFYNAIDPPPKRLV